MSLSPQDVGARIKQTRKALGWTNDHLAGLMDVNSRTVQRWQKGIYPDGKSALPRLATLMRLAEVLGLQPEELIEPVEQAASAAEVLQVLRGLGTRLGRLETGQRKLVAQIAKLQNGDP